MKYFILILVSVVVSHAHTSYTAYSGATGSKGYCASSCHGTNTGGTITITGIPQTYVPLASYTISVKHNGGSTISNFNVSSRKGTTSAAAGTFTAGTNSALYSVSGYENGVRGSVNSIDEATFTWIAPAAGSGEVKIYLSGLQGSKSGATTKLIVSAAENVTGIPETRSIVSSFDLQQNYPNPFNPTTTIRYSIPQSGMVEITMYDVIGNEIRTLVYEHQERGIHSVVVDMVDAHKKSTLSGGIYFYSLRMNGLVQTKKMVLLK